MDRIAGASRSALMSRVRSRNTQPERAVRRAAFALGLRFRLHRRDLPGTPDLVFPKYKVAIMVHGCFWHQHKGCKRATVPKTRVDFWKRKLHGNIERDGAVVDKLKALGWQVEIIWECETRNEETLRDRLDVFFRRTNRGVQA